MKKLLLLLLLPMSAFADRLGLLRSGSDVLLTTQAVAGTGGCYAVEPATVTFNLAKGVSASTITVSTVTVNQVPYAGGVGGGLIGSPSLVYFSSADVGSLGHENLIEKGLSPFIVQASSNAMGFIFTDNYQQYANKNLWAAIVEHPNAFPSISVGLMNIYQRDGGHIFVDMTGQSTNNAGTFQVRVADAQNEGTPWMALQTNATSQTLISDIHKNCSAVSATTQYCFTEPSAVLEATSTTRGFLPPRMTTTQKNAIASPAAGLMVYDTTLSTMSFYNGAAWITFGGGAGGSGSPGGSSGQIQYNGASAFAGSANTFVTASSVTISTPSFVGQVGINTALTPNETLKIVQTANGAAGAASLIVFPAANANGTVIDLYNAKQGRALYLDAVDSHLDVSYGLTAGSATVSNLTASLPVQTDANKRLISGLISVSTSVIGTLPVANGGTGTTSPGLVPGTNITSITGTWPNQTINAATQAGGGGSSSLAFAIGSTTSWKTQVSSPTAAVVADQSQFYGQALGSGTTAFFSLAESTTAVSASYTTTSTDTVIMANCASACIVTLSTSATIPNKVLTVGQLGAGNVTLTPAAGNISGGATALMNAIGTFLDVKYDGTNFWVK